MGMNKTKKSTKQKSIRIKNETLEKIKKLNKLKGKKESAIEYIVNLALDSYFEDKFLSNEDKFLEDTGICIPYEFYFSKKELLENNTVITTNDKYCSTLNDCMYISRTPNNLDSFNNEFNTFCYGDNPNIHKGIITNDGLIEGKVVILLITTDLEKKISKIDLYKYPKDLNLIDEVTSHNNKDDIINNITNNFVYSNLLMDYFRAIVNNDDDLASIIQKQLKNIDSDVIVKSLIYNGDILSSLYFHIDGFDELDFIESLNTILTDNGKEAVIRKIDNAFIHGKTDSHHIIRVILNCDRCGYHQELSNVLKKYIKSKFPHFNNYSNVSKG